MCLSIFLSLWAYNRWRVSSRRVMRLINPEPDPQRGPLPTVSKIQHRLLLCAQVLSRDLFCWLQLSPNIYFFVLKRVTLSATLTYMFSHSLWKSVEYETRNIHDYWVCVASVKLTDNLDIYVRVLRPSLEELSWKDLTPSCNGIVSGTQWLICFYRMN